VQDLNYGPWLGLPMDDFAVAGPGSIRGIQKCFYNPNKILPAKIIKLVTKYQDECSLAATGQLPPRINGHKLLPQSAFQNLLCETDKASRVVFSECQLGPTRIKFRYTVADGTIRRLEAPFLPHFYL